MPSKRCADFLSKLPDDEPAFTVRARDPLILDIMKMWIVKAQALGVNNKKIMHVEDILYKEVIPWQRDNLTKIPD